MPFSGRDIFLWTLLVFRVFAQVSGTISVSCDFRYILIFIEDVSLKLESLPATGFYIGQNDSHCYADKNSYIVIPFPFRQCQMKTMLYEDGVVYSNTIFMDTWSGNAQKYAEFRCQYGITSSVGTALQSQYNISTNQFNGGLVRDVTMCNSLRYCPSRSCPTSLKIHDQTVFFADSVMHMSIFTDVGALKEQDITESVSAIDHLLIQCIDEYSSQKLQFQSVTNGCYATKSFFNRDVSTVVTHINYNTQSNIICISIDVPPVEICRSFVVTGVVVTCKKSNEKVCNDYSGSRCSNVETSENFTLGPFHITPKNKVRAHVKYVIASTESTTRLSYHSNSTTQESPLEYGDAAIDEAATVTRSQNAVDNTLVSVSTSDVDKFGEAGEKAVLPKNFVESTPSRNFDYVEVSSIDTLGKFRIAEERSFQGSEGDVINASPPYFDLNIPGQFTETYGTLPSSETASSVRYAQTTSKREGSGDELSAEFDVAQIHSRLQPRHHTKIHQPGPQTPSEYTVTESTVDLPTSMSNGLANDSQPLVNASSLNQNQYADQMISKDISTIAGQRTLVIHGREAESSADFDDVISLNKASTKPVEHLLLPNFLKPGYPTQSSVEENMVTRNRHAVLQFDIDRPKPLNFGEKDAERKRILSRNGVSKVTTLETVTKLLPHTDERYSQPNRSGVEGSSQETYSTTLQTDASDGVETLQVANEGDSHAEESKTPLRYFDEYEANESFIRAGVSALGVFLLCSVALTAAWIVNRRNSKRRKNEWVEVSSRL